MSIQTERGKRHISILLAVGCSTKQLRVGANHPVGHLQSLLLLNRNNPEQALREKAQTGPSSGLTRSPYPARRSNHRPSTSGPTSTGSPTLLPFPPPPPPPPPPAMADGVATTGKLPPPPPRVAVASSTAGTSGEILRPSPFPWLSPPPE